MISFAIFEAAVAANSPPVRHGGVGLATNCFPTRIRVFIEVISSETVRSPAFGLCRNRCVLMLPVAVNLPPDCVTTIDAGPAIPKERSGGSKLGLSDLRP